MGSSFQIYLVFWINILLRLACLSVSSCAGWSILLVVVIVTLLSSEPEVQYVALRNINLIVQKRYVLYTWYTSSYKIVHVKICVSMTLYLPALMPWGVRLMPVGQKLRSQVHLGLLTSFLHLTGKKSCCSHIWQMVGE